jgi:hypothetical protein
MQSPIIYFDHINKQVVTIQPGPAHDKKLAELAQQPAVATAGAPRRTV